MLLLTAALAVVQARGDDWPEFRGPTGQGLVSGGHLPAHWGRTENVVWKQVIPGKGWSSPVVHGERIYLTTSVSSQRSSGNAHSLQAICLDATSGTTLWTKEVFEEQGASAVAIHTKNSHASPTPLVRDGRVFVHFGHQGTACLDLSGEILWRNTSLKYAPVHGNGGSPILVGDALIFSCDGGDKRFVAALDKSTGQVRWTIRRSGDAERPFSFSTPLAITVEGRTQVVSPGSDMVAAYEVDDGHEIWRVRYDGYSVVPRPVYGHGLVYICTCYDRPTLLAIRPDGRGDVTATHIAWSTERAAPHAPSLLLVGEELYMVSDLGMASCLDAKTGKVHWQERLGGNYSASPILAGGRIYFQSEEGTGTVIKAGRQFERLARNSLGERTLASYAVVDGAIYIR